MDFATIFRLEENLNLPDFRTHERYIQLLNQVVGRTGRHTKYSKVIIQTLKPENKLCPYESFVLAKSTNDSFRELTSVNIALLLKPS